jgi:5-methylcytosine-specific restriction endonuclease McrA
VAARAAINKWVRDNGYVCPGWARPPHDADPANPLTADHVVPNSAGGSADDGIRVLCRECNSRRGTMRRRNG